MFNALKSLTWSWRVLWECFSPLPGRSIPLVPSAGDRAIDGEYVSIRNVTTTRFLAELTLLYSRI